MLLYFTLEKCLQSWTHLNEGCLLCFIFMKLLLNFILTFYLEYFMIINGVRNFMLGSHFLSFILNLLLAIWNIIVVTDTDLKFIVDFLTKISSCFETFFNPHWAIVYIFSFLFYICFQDKYYIFFKMSSSKILQSSEAMMLGNVICRRYVFKNSIFSSKLNICLVSEWNHFI